MSSHYPAEFKQMAVELVTTQRKSIAQVSFALNVAKRTCAKFTRHFGLDNTNDCFDVVARS